MVNNEQRSTHKPSQAEIYKLAQSILADPRISEKQKQYWGSLLLGYTINQYLAPHMAKLNAHFQKLSSYGVKLSRK